jgi:hypothetical protein
MEDQKNKDKLIGIAFLESLTPTGKEVFFTLIEGNAYKKCSEILNIKVSTVKKHRENICNKIRDLLPGECSCRKWATVGYQWVKFGFKTGIIDGEKWVADVKEKPFYRS